MENSTCDNVRSLGFKLGKTHAARHMTSLMTRLRAGTLRKNSPTTTSPEPSKDFKTPKHDNSPYIEFLMQYLSLKSVDTAIDATRRLRERPPPKRLGARRFLISELRSYLPTPPSSPSLSPVSTTSSTVSTSTSLSVFSIDEDEEDREEEMKKKTKGKKTQLSFKIPTLQLPSNASLKKDFQSTFASVDKSLSWRLESLRHRRHRLLSLHPNLIREMFWTALFLAKSEKVHTETLPELVSSLTSTLKLNDPPCPSLYIPLHLLSKRLKTTTTEEEEEEEEESILYRGAYSVVTSNSFAVTKRFREDRVSLSRMCSEVEFFKMFSSELFIDAFDLSLRSRLANCTLASYAVRHIKKKTVSKQMFRSILRRVLELHENGVTHYDIRGDNIVIFEDKVYLIDFGDASSDSLSESDSRGTERISDLNVPLVPFKSDVYSLGCLMYELYSGGSYLFEEGQVTRESRRDRIRSRVDLFDDDVMRRCFLKCLQDRPEDRPSVSELLEWLE